MSSQSSAQSDSGSTTQSPAPPAWAKSGSNQPQQQQSGSSSSSGLSSSSPVQSQSTPPETVPSSSMQPPSQSKLQPTVHRQSGSSNLPPSSSSQSESSQPVPSQPALAGSQPSAAQMPSTPQQPEGQTNTQQTDSDSVQPPTNQASSSATNQSSQPFQTPLPPAPAPAPATTTQPASQESSLPPLQQSSNSDTQSSSQNFDPIGSTYQGDTGSVSPPSFGSSDNGNTNNSDTMAVPLENSRFGWVKNLFIVLLVIALLGGLAYLAVVFLLPNFGLDLFNTGSDDSDSPVQAQQVTLTYWGLWEPSQVMDEIIAQYNQENPNVTIEYKQETHRDYRARLQTALQGKQGPDIFRYHSSWLPMLDQQLAAAPTGTIAIDEYFPVVAQDVVRGGDVYGVPLGFDTLALFYNPDLFEKAGQDVPTRWDELRTAAQRLRVPQDPDEPIQVAGVALGTTNNVEHFSDILGLMMMQNGVNLADPNSTQNLSATALLFYTLFESQDKVWDETLPPSVYAFATEKVAMIFAPSWRAFDIWSHNPQLEFRTAPVPQLPEQNVAWATYWVEGVSKQSQHQQEAWKFLQYLSSDQNLQALYTAQKSVRSFGEPYPKISLAASLESDPVVGAFVSQGEYAQSWYLNSRTWDSGLNDRTIKYLEDAVNAIQSGDRPTQVVPTMASGFSQVLSQFGVQSGQAVTSGQQFVIEGIPLDQEATPSAQ